MRWRARATSGGTSSRQARSASNRRRKTGKPAASPTCRTNTNSSRCRNNLCAACSLPPAAHAGTATLSKEFFMTTMLSSDLPLQKLGRGKVRDIYAVDDERLLLLTTDRISAFDVVMG